MKKKKYHTMAVAVTPTRAATTATTAAPTTATTTATTSSVGRHRHADRINDGNDGNSDRDNTHRPLVLLEPVHLRLYGLESSYDIPCERTIASEKGKQRWAEKKKMTKVLPSAPLNMSARCQVHPEALQSLGVSPGDPVLVLALSDGPLLPGNIKVERTLRCFLCTLWTNPDLGRLETAVDGRVKIPLDIGTGFNIGIGLTSDFVSSNDDNNDNSSNNYDSKNDTNTSNGNGSNTSNKNDDNSSSNNNGHTDKKKPNSPRDTGNNSNTTTPAVTMATTPPTTMVARFLKQAADRCRQHSGDQKDDGGAAVVGVISLSPSSQFLPNKVVDGGRAGGGISSSSSSCSRGRGGEGGVVPPLAGSVTAQVDCALSLPPDYTSMVKQSLRHLFVSDGCVVAVPCWPSSEGFSGVQSAGPEARRGGVDDDGGRSRGGGEGGDGGGEFSSAARHERGGGAVNGGEKNRPKNGGSEASSVNVIGSTSSIVFARILCSSSPSLSCLWPPSPSQTSPSSPPSSSSAVSSLAPRDTPSSSSSSRYTPGSASASASTLLAAPLVAGLAATGRKTDGDLGIDRNKRVSIKSRGGVILEGLLRGGGVCAIGPESVVLVEAEAEAGRKGEGEEGLQQHARRKWDGIAGSDGHGAGGGTGDGDDGDNEPGTKCGRRGCGDACCRHRVAPRLACWNSSAR